MVDPHPRMVEPSTQTLALARGLGLEEKMTVKGHLPLAGEPLHLSQCSMDQDGGTPHSHTAKPQMEIALPVAGETLCLPVILEMEELHPGVLRTRNPAGMMAR